MGLHTHLLFSKGLIYMKLRIVNGNNNDLWKRDLYSIDLDSVLNTQIYEYDMRSAGLSLCEYYGLLDDRMLYYLKTLTKELRNYKIGCLRRDDKKFNVALSKAFANMRYRFFISNDLCNNDIISIRKDALFVTRRCADTKFRNVEFVLKNKFTSMHRFDKYEFYYRNSGNYITCKGIDDNKLVVHNEYMLKFLSHVFRTIEISDNQQVVKYIKRFASDYKQYELAVGYYRELNSESLYNMSADDMNIKIGGYIKGLNLNISYNYHTYILRLMQRFFFIKN